MMWPIEFYRDREWPFTQLDFHEIPGSAWPMAHLKPGIAELRFLSWGMSFLMGRIAISSRTFIAYAEELESDVVKSIEEGGDLTMIPLKRAMAKDVRQLVQFLQ